MGAAFLPLGEASVLRALLGFFLPDLGFVVCLL
jgi:hypothetical protein